MSMTQQQNVPALRFPEFGGEWEIARLASMVNKVGSGITPRGGADVYQDTGIPLLRSQNIRDSRLDLTDVAFISEEMNAKMKGSAVEPNDVLLNITGASIGRSCVVPPDIGTANVNQHVCIIRLGDDNSPSFLQLFLASQRGQKLIFQSQSGSGREGLNFENIKTFKMAFPTLPEQQKIASFLSAVDRKIGQLGEKKALLQKYKKGCMQKLFSQQLRFKDDDGNDFPDWEEKRLGENLAPHKERVRFDTSIPIYSSSRTGLKRQKDYFADREINNEGEYGVVPIGCITYRHMSDDLTFKFNLNNLKSPIAVSKEYPVFATPAMNSLFLVFWLNNSKEFGRFAAMQKLGGTRTRLYYRVLADWKVKLPSVLEQQKIADFLSSVDQKIDLVSTELDHAKAFKKGLLQQMFV